MRRGREMKIVMGWISLIVLSACVSATSVKREPQASAPTPEVRELAAILGRHTVALERDLWTFRYESTRESFNPKNVSDVAENLSNWMLRFYDPDIVSGADVGPGVYVATDPV